MPNSDFLYRVRGTTTEEHILTHQRAILIRIKDGSPVMFGSFNTCEAVLKELEASYFRGAQDVKEGRLIL